MKIILLAAVSMFLVSCASVSSPTHVSRLDRHGMSKSDFIRWAR